VTDAAFSNVQIFDPQGNILLFMGQLGPRPGDFHLPAGISIDENDRIYVADQLNSRIQVFQYLKTQESTARHDAEKPSFRGIIQSLGLVFGDIGTSPIYTLTVIFLLTKPTEDHVIGVLSLIVWTLLLLVTVQYAWLAMSLGRRGEGGPSCFASSLFLFSGPEGRLPSSPSCPSSAFP